MENGIKKDGESEIIGLMIKSGEREKKWRKFFE
ncbi:transposase [Staphylococcus aureus]